jgi:spermidine synthase
MLGHLPMLLHPEANDVLVIGLGSGMTLGAVELYPADTIDVVELEPAVVRASTYFASFTGEVLDDPRVNLLVTDGRNHLALTDRQYDVIISEPSNPWVAGMANLFTREFFEMSKKRLREGGMICQWLHAYSMTSEDFQTLVATFQSVFPHAILWERGLAGDYILIGSLDEIDIPYETVRARLNDETKADHFKTMNLSDIPSLLGKVLMEEKGAADYARGAILHTDDNARLEYSAPKGLFKNEKETLLRDIYEHRSSPEEVFGAFGWQGAPSGDRDKVERMFQARDELQSGYLHMQEHDGTAAIESLTRALASNPRDATAADLLQKIYVEMGERFEQIADQEKAQEAYAKASKVLSDFTSDDPELLKHQYELNRAYAGIQHRLRRMSLVVANEEDEDSPESHNNLGTTYERLDQLDAAMEEYQKALEMKPDYVDARVNYANVCLRLGRPEEAIDNYRQALQLEPNYEMTHYNLGVAFYQQMKWEEAANAWRRALELNPNFPQARQSLDKVLSILAGQ